MAAPKEHVEIQRHAMTPRTDEDGHPVSKIVPYEPVKNPCLVCPAKCCKLVVKICVPDAIHYCRTLGVPFFSGLTLAATTDERRSFLLDPDPRLVTTGAWSGRVEIQLRRQENGYCHGLISIGGYERCGIYDARPTFCRTYPVSWKAETALGGPPAVLCPVPYALPPTVEAAFVEDIRHQIELWKLHDEISKAWNQSVRPTRTLEDLLAFIIPMAGERLGVSVEGILAGGDPSQRLYDVMTNARVLARSPFEATVHAPRIYAGLAAAQQPKE